MTDKGNSMLLEVEELDSGYRNAQILYDVSLSVGAGEIVGLIGHNGAGKSTLLKTLMGLVRPTGGRIRYDGEELTLSSPAEKLDRGIFHIPQENYIFRELSVRDNLELSFLRHSGSADFSVRLEEVFGFFPILKNRLSQESGTLSGGERRMLGIAMGLLRHPRLLLIDEPSAGLSPRIFQDVLSVIRDINTNMGTAIILVEQNVKAAFQLSSRVYVMKSGRIFFEETGEALLKRDEWWDLF